MKNVIAVRADEKEGEGSIGSLLKEAVESDAFSRAITEDSFMTVRQAAVVGGKMIEFDHVSVTFQNRGRNFMRCRMSP